jgi:hypothetical protein
MSRVIFTCLILSLSLAAHAHRTYLCSNADHSIMLTRDSLVIVKKNAGEQFVLQLKNLSMDSSLFKNEVFNLTDTGDWQHRISQLKITASSTAKQVSSLGSETCDQGTAPGFQTLANNITAVLSLPNEQRTVELACLETSSWSGGCYPE